MNTKKVIEEYVAGSDWRAKENASSTFSYSGLKNHISNQAISEYCLNEIYPPHIKEMHEKGVVHIHDLGEGITHYCIGLSLKQLITMGFGGIPGKTDSGPAKHLSALLGQMVNYMGSMQMEGAGARAYNSVDTLVAPFIWHDGLTYDQVKQEVQQFIFYLNISARWGCAPVFSNMTFDVVSNKVLDGEYAIIGGKPIDKKYGEFQKEKDMFNKAFLEIMLHGDFGQRPFSFPIPTYNITATFFSEINAEIKDLLLKATARYGYPYFQNFMNSSLRPEDVYSMCCRLSLNMEQLRTKSGGLFGNDDNTGSMGVVTISLPYVAYISDGVINFFKHLDDILESSVEALLIKRKKVEEYTEQGLFPYTSHFIRHYKFLFNTIGIIGMYEALKKLGYDLSTAEGLGIAQSILNHLNEKLLMYQNKYGQMFNLEATPCESAAYRLAKQNKKYCKGIITSGTKDAPFYTAATFLPSDFTEDIWTVVDHQAQLNPIYTGGTVLHLFLGEEPTPESVEIIITKIFSKTRLPYISITPTYTICPSCGHMPGEHDICPKCGGKETEVYSRVVGYYRPKKNFNVGKRAEYDIRKKFKI